MNRARPDPISAPDSQQFDAKLSKTPRIQTAAPKCAGISERREFSSLSEHSAADRTKASRIRTGMDRNRAEAKTPHHSSAPQAQRGTETRNPAPKPHNSAEFPGTSTSCSPRRRRRAPASDRPRIAGAPPRPDPPRSLDPRGIIPPPLPLGAPSLSLLALLHLSSFIFISLSPPSPSLLSSPPSVRLGFFFWWWRCVVRWCGLAKTPQNQPRLLKPPTPNPVPHLAYAHAIPGRGATGCSRLNPTRPRPNDRFRTPAASTWPPHVIRRQRAPVPASYSGFGVPAPVTRAADLGRRWGERTRLPHRRIRGALESLVTTNARSDPC